MSTPPVPNPQVKQAAAPTAAEFEQLQAQLAQALQVIADLSPKAPPPAVEKRYYSRAPFCNIHVMTAQGVCEQLQFIAGALDTKDPGVQQQLDAVARVPGGAISTENIFGHVKLAEVTEMQDDLAKIAASSHARMLASGLPTA